MIELAKKSYPKIAISIDVRNLPDTGHEELLNDIYLKVNNDPMIDSTIIFIDADDQVLIKRYSETRRLHPLSLKNLTLNEAIQKETEILKIISSVADLRIDTTNLSIHDLCKNVISSINGKPFKEVVLIFESFGYKDGITKEADFVFDARFLPNPYWDKNIRSYCGLEEPIKNFFAKYFNNLRWRHYKFWIAAYTSKQPELAGGQDYIMWQFTDKSRVQGIRGGVDMSRFVFGHTIDDILYRR